MDAGYIRVSSSQCRSTDMLSLLVLALEIMDEEARPLGLTINWSQTKIQTMLDPAPAGNQVTATVWKSWNHFLT